jgi:hypothetical protein
VLDAIEAVQRRYCECAVAALLTGNTALLTPVQLAELWVSCWPYMSRERALTAAPTAGLTGSVDRGAQ